MEKLTDYVKWYGRLGFDQAPFTDIDALVLTYLSYYDFKRVLPDEEAVLEIGELQRKNASLRLLSVGGNGGREAADFLNLLSLSKRYASVKVTHFSERYDLKIPIQFAALTFRIDENFAFMAYRGTDDTLAGWKEDFMISFTETEAQKEAYRYLARSMEPGTRYMIGGHSKGGNLALYAVSKLNEALYERIDRVYLLDSPGFAPEVLPEKRISDIDRKLIFISPRYSVVGRLFEVAVSDKRIVLSDEDGLMQHDLASWLLDHGELCYVKEHDAASSYLIDAVNDWISGIPVSDRARMVDDLFQVLSSGGARTVSDIQKGGNAGVEAMVLRFLGISRKTRKNLGSLPLKAVFGDTRDRLFQKGFFSWLIKNGIFIAVLLIVLGALTVILRESVIRIPLAIALSGFMLVQIVLLIKRLHENGFNIHPVRYQIYVCLSLLALTLVFIMKQNALAVFGSLILGVFLLILSYQSFTRLMRHKGFYRVLGIAEAAGAFLGGINFLLFPEEMLPVSTLIIGILLMLDGLLRVGFLVFQAVRKKRDSLDFSR